MIPKIKKFITEYFSHRLMRKHNWHDLSRPRESDVVVAAFPKSGNTWMQCILAGIQYGVDASSAPDSLIQELVPDVHQRRVGRRHSNSVCFKSHSLPAPEYRKVIHLVRDPRAVVVSYLHYRNALGARMSFDDVIAEDHPIYRNWPIHTNSWMQNPYKAEVLLVRYEDLIIKPLVEIKIISEFISRPLTEKRVAEVCEWTDFKALRARERTLGWDNANWPSDIPFLRRGTKDSWKTELSEEQIIFLSEKYEAVMAQAGYH